MNFAERDASDFHKPEMDRPRSRAPSRPGGPGPPRFRIQRPLAAFPFSKKERPGSRAYLVTENGQPARQPHLKLLANAALNFPGPRRTFPFPGIDLARHLDPRFRRKQGPAALRNRPHARTINPPLGHAPVRGQPSV